MGKGDHIVIPKSILKRFVDENNRITYLDLKDFSIGKKMLNSIFTEKDYYLDEIDKIIKDKDETIIGNLYKSISENKDKDLKLKISDVNYMRYIFFLQYFRNNSFSTDLARKVHFFDRKTIHNISIASIIKHLEDGTVEGIKLRSIYNKMEKEYKKYTPGCMIIDNIKSSFLLPASQFTRCSILKSEAYIYPIAPDIALIWKQNTTNEFEFGKTQDNKLVEKINKLIIESEISNNTDYLVFGKQEEIEKILYIKKEVSNK